MKSFWTLTTILTLIFISAGSLYAKEFYLSLPLPPNTQYNNVNNNTIRPAPSEKTAETAEKEKQTAKLNLQGIIKVSNDYTALINGRIHKTGDKINSYKIISIDSDNVLLSKNGNRVELYVGKD